VTRKSAIYNFAAELAKECEEAYDDYISAYLAAVEPHLPTFHAVPVESMIRGVGHHMKLQAYGSPELKEYVEQHPLLTRNQFEEQWLGDRYA